MLGSQGIQHVTLVFNNSKNCFLQLSSNFANHLCLHENQILELSWGASPPVFLSWIKSRSSGPDDTVEVSRKLGEKLGLREGAQGYLRPCHQVQSVQQVFVEPLSPDDWEILELHSMTLEQRLLDQIRVVYSDAVLPVWVDQHTVIYIKITSLSPSVPYGRLEQFTELLVSPKINPGTERFQKSESEESYQQFQQPTIDANSSSSTSIHHGSCPDYPGSENEVRWGGIRGLKSLVRYLFTGELEVPKEKYAIPTIPTVLKHCILRTCGRPPMSGCHGLAYGDVHVLPWHFQEQESRNPGQSALTYGRLSKILSPKELRGKLKHAMEKKKIRDHLPQGKSTEEHEESFLVVRMLCHNVKKLQEDQNCSKCENIYSGKIWIPEMLRKRLKIEPHSAVRIEPLNALPRVAETVVLQPLQAIAESEKEELIQTALLNWLHAQSHQPLTCLTGRSNIILLPCAEGKEEFVLTVLKPEQVQEDEIFFLSNNLLKKTHIQIIREPLDSDDRGSGIDHEDPFLEFPTINSLGGVEDISSSGFQHISHALMGCSLSRELVSAGRGLRGGALLITGAKGSGKSSLSRALCQKASEMLDAHVQVLDCRTLRGKRTDTVKQKLEDVFEQAVWRQPSVVLLEDLDHVAGAATSPEHEHGPEATQRQLIAQSLKDLVDEMVLRSSLIALIVTARDEHSLHRTLTTVQGSHIFQSFCGIPTPDQAQRIEILRSLIARNNFEACQTALDLDFVAKETEGFMPRDLNLLLERAIHASIAHSRSNKVLSTEDFKHALQGFIPPSLWGAQLQVPSGPGMEKIGGLHQARQLLMDIIMLPAKFPLLFSNLPMRQCSGVLLYGAPGTGKTLLAGAVAKESGMNFISIKGPELLSKYIGASEQAVRDVFERAQQAKPCILFFDEFDSLAPRRGHDNTGVTDRVVNQLLTQLDGVEGLTGVYVLAATSRPDLIDPALLRPGRLDKVLYCRPPDKEERLEILNALTAGVPLAEDVNLQQIAGTTEMFTGADLKALLYNAQLEAIHGSLVNLVHDPGSDSDVSLSSLIFLNHSSGSDDSSGEGDPGPERSMVLLEHSDLPTEDPQSNIWRFYFGSSFESEPDSQSLYSQSLSGPNSTALELMGVSLKTPVSCPEGIGASLRDPGLCQAPAFMSCVQRGFEELSQEQTERLRVEVNTVKRSYCGYMEEMSSSSLGPTSSGKPGSLIRQSHLTTALTNTRASINKEDWKRYTQLYESFGASKEGHSKSSALFQVGQRVTLA